MIKRLRTKCICITMVLMMVLLLSLITLLCYTTWQSLEEESNMALQSAPLEPWKPGGMEGETPYPNYPCFILCLDPFGTLSSTGHAYYDLSDEEMLMEILQEAQDTGKSSGYLLERNLKFQKIELWKMEEYVFTDISYQILSMQRLRLNCVLLFFGGMVLSFAIAWWLSKWMIRPIENAWEQQRQFVADASHELKTPLTVILTNTEMLQSDAFDVPAKRRMTDGIAIMGSQMRDLVENLLELAKIEGSQATAEERVHFSVVAEKSCLLFEPVYFESGRELETQVQQGIYVRGSAQHLKQLLEVLLDNGSKYATPDSRVTLKLERNHNHCLLQMQSQGATLTPRQCKDIFKRFYRVDDVRSRSHSYGLGLAIAQTIVQAHRGKIWAVSKEGVNTFYVLLPTCHPEK